MCVELRGQAVDLFSRLANSAIKNDRKCHIVRGRLFRGGSLLFRGGSFGDLTCRGTPDRLVDPDLIPGQSRNDDQDNKNAGSAKSAHGVLKGTWGPQRNLGSSRNWGPQRNLVSSN